MTKRDDKKKPGPEPERLKIEGFTMEEVAEKMIQTSTAGADWNSLLAKQKKRQQEEAEDDSSEPDPHDCYRLPARLD